MFFVLVGCPCASWGKGTLGDLMFLGCSGWRRGSCSCRMFLCPRSNSTVLFVGLVLFFHPQVIGPSLLNRTPAALPLLLASPEPTLQSRSARLRPARQAGSYSSGPTTVARRKYLSF